MTEGDAAYSDVVHSGEVAGYTGAEGYTGVVPVPGSVRSSGAPISEEGRPLSAEALKAEFGTMVAPPRRDTPGAGRTRRPGRRESPADAAVMDRGEAPGQAGPLFDGPSPPPLVQAAPDADGGPPAERDEEAAAEADRASTAAADAASADRAEGMARLVTAVVDAQRRYLSKPQPTPRRALETAKGLLRGDIVPDSVMSPFSPIPRLGPSGSEPGMGPAGPFRQDLLGPGADLLKRQAVEAIAPSRPTRLGVAYLQGVGLGLFDAAVDAVQGMAETAVDPLGSAIRQQAQIIAQIDERIARGESPWEAANNVLNPVARFVHQARLADELAGRALDIAGHDWDEAVRLSREAGRAAASGGMAAVDTFYLARNGISRGKRLADTIRRPSPPRGGPPAPPPAPARPKPRPPSRPDGSTGRRTSLQPPAGPRSEVAPIPVLPAESGPITGKVYRNGPQGLQVPSHTTPHPARPELPIYNRSWLRQSHEFQKLATDVARDTGRKIKNSLPKPKPGRETARQYLRYAKAIINELERETALEAALANPSHGYLTQVSLVEVQPPNGPPIPIAQINKNLGETKGRILDYLDLHPDGSFTFNENKFSREILRSYSDSGGVFPPRFVDKIGSQTRRETNFVDFAKGIQGSSLIVQGKTFDGRTVRLSLDPNRFRGSAVSPYLMAGDN